MPTNPGPPLRKVTLNLYDDDVARLEAFYGHGWSSAIREVIHLHTFKMREGQFSQPRTLGDLDVG